MRKCVGVLLIVCVALVLSGGTAIADLTQINLLGPPNGAVLVAPPTFEWNAEGGTSNRFAIDFAPTRSGPWVSTWENARLIIFEESVNTPPAVWGAVPPGRTLYWRVRGIDVSIRPVTVITSDETGSFMKQ